MPPSHSNLWEEERSAALLGPMFAEHAETLPLSAIQATEFHECSPSSSSPSLFESSEGSPQS